MSGRKELANICGAILLAMTFAASLPMGSAAQSSGAERAFPQSKAKVEQALKALQSASGGRLPVLDGFALAGDHPLDRYRRGYYQTKIEVVASPTGGSIVRVKAEVTAWYNDPAGVHSGYQLLPSNGRLEADFLDQLGDQLASGPSAEQASQSAENAPQSVPQNVPRQISPQKVESVPAPATVESASNAAPSAAPKKAAPAPATTAAASSKPTPPAAKTASANEPTVSAPMPRLPETGGGVLGSLAQQLAEQQKEQADAKNPPAPPDQKNLQAEEQSLEEVLKNQAHPNNLVAVKKSGTPVVATPSLNAKPLFMASAHDEFEMIDFNQDWVHVRVSGLSRGWIWRNNLEMPDNIPDSDSPTNAAAPVAADIFRVSREEQAPFPGDWAPLRGKTVKIITVEKVDEAAKDSGPQLRLEFAKSVLEKNYAEVAQKATEVSGIVLIFDSSDGGMIAASLPTLQQWKAGALSDAALWHQCFFDPPESFTASAAPAGN